MIAPASESWGEFSWMRSTITLCWVAIVALHLIGITLPLLTGLIHLFLSLPIASQPQAHLRIPTHLLLISGISYIFVAALHVRGVYTMVARSIRHRSLVFYKSRLEVATTRRPNAGPNEKMAVLARIKGLVFWPLRTWSSLFGLQGLFGLHGKYFDEALVARETLEIVLQTYQLNALSYAVSSTWANRLAVTFVVINCFSTPIVDLVFRRTSHHTRRRLAHLVLDMSLDFCGAIVIPSCIMYPYISELDWAQGSVPAKIALNDVWYVSAVATVRQVLVSSVLDYLSSMLPQVSFLGCLTTLKHLLTRVQAQHQPSLSKALRVHPTHLINSATQTLPVTFKRCVMKRVLYAMYFVWGSLILFAHITSTRYSIHETRGCRLGLDPWYATGVPCVVIHINCHLQGIHGHLEELGHILEPLDRLILTQLIITHCSALEMSPMVTEFSSLMSIDLFNCSLARWSSDAAFTDRTNPALGSLYMMSVNMTEFPAGLLHSNLPSRLANFRINRSNLTVLPETLGDVWAAHRFYAINFEHMALGKAPRFLQRLSVATLSLVSCGIDQIAEDFFADKQMLWLFLSGNPLHSLPHSVGEMTTLTRLVLELTQLRSLPPSLDWLVEESLVHPQRLWFHGSPICETPVADAWMGNPHVCAQYHATDVSSLRTEHVLPQRRIDFEGEDGR